jgi:hypothetical protein
MLSGMSILQLCRGQLCAARLVKDPSAVQIREMPVSKKPTRAANRVTAEVDESLKLPQSADFLATQQSLCGPFAGASESLTKQSRRAKSEIPRSIVDQETNSVTELPPHIKSLKES